MNKMILSVIKKTLNKKCVRMYVQSYRSTSAGKSNTDLYVIITVKSMKSKLTAIMSVQR